MSHLGHRSVFALSSLSFLICWAAGSDGAAAAEQRSLTEPAGPSRAAAPLQPVPGTVGGTIQQAQLGIEVPKPEVRVPRGETVTSRPRPELDALGGHVGSFLVLPSLTLDERYDDNIYASKNNKQNDFITRVTPALSVRSDWNNHQLTFRGRGVIGRHLDNSSEDFEDFSLETSGRLDIRRDSKLRAGVGYQRLHEERSSPDSADINSTEPTVYDDLSANMSFYQRLNRFNFTVGGVFNRFSFENGLRSNGTVIDNGVRDRDELETSLRVGYEIVPQYEAFVRGSYFLRNYNASADNNDINRDSDGLEFVAGLELDLGGVTFGNVFAGYRSQSYDDPTLETIDGPVVGGEVTWNVTPLTTVIGSVSRIIRETTTRDNQGNFASGRLFTTAEISVDHELLRNLLLGSNVSYSNDDFQGIDRSDDIYRAGIYARYMMNRYIYLISGYDLRVRNSQVNSADFTENVIYARLRLQY